MEELLFETKFLSETSSSFDTVFVTESESVFETEFHTECTAVFETEFLLDEGYDVYEGDYTVVPSRHTQTLDTSSKVMKSDVVVTDIPYSITSNTAGGTTFYIAKENM